MDEQLLTAPQAAALATGWRRLLSAGAAEVSPAAIRQWASRGHLARAGLTERGWPLYRRADVARAELATRTHALRIAGVRPTWLPARSAGVAPGPQAPRHPDAGPAA